MAFMQGQSGTYANFLFSSFPLIRRRAILDKSFAAFLRRSLPYRRSIRPPGGRARWGVVQLVGHLTVNEDGEGSNPSAPAKFSTNPTRYSKARVSNACALIAIET